MLADETRTTEDGDIVGVIRAGLGNGGNRGVIGNRCGLLTQSDETQARFAGWFCAGREVFVERTDRSDHRAVKAVGLTAEAEDLTRVRTKATESLTGGLFRNLKAAAGMVDRRDLCVRTPAHDTAFEHFGFDHTVIAERGDRPAWIVCAKHHLKLGVAFLRLERQ